MTYLLIAVLVLLYLNISLLIITCYNDNSAELQYEWDMEKPLIKVFAVLVMPLRFPFLKWVEFRDTSRRTNSKENR